MASDLTPELTKQDWETLGDFRILRLQGMFPVLQYARLKLSCLTNDLLLICDRPTWQKLQPVLVEIRMASWSIAAASNLSIFADNHLVYCAMTQLPATVTTIEPTLDSNVKRLDSSMVTATKARPADTVTPSVKSPPSTTGDVNALPAFVDLMPLAQKSGIPIDRIATEIHQLGGVAGRDRTGAYITTDKDQRTWVKAYLQRLEAEFLLTPELPAVSQPPTVAAPKRTKADPAQKNGRTAAPVQDTRTSPKNFKDFAKAQSYAVTIGRFLDAQGWQEDNPLRAQVFEGIAALPDDAMPAKGGNLAQRALTKILSKYPASSRVAVAKGYIKIARETIGNAKPTELAVAESTEAP